MTDKQIAPDEFTLLLRAFNSLVIGLPPREQIKQELDDLKASAETSVELNLRQKDAIIVRCNNYLNGTYGKTKEGVTFISEPNKSK